MGSQRDMNEWLNWLTEEEKECRNTWFCHALLYHPLQMLFFKNWMLVVTCIQQVYQHHFSNSICSLQIFVSPFGNCNISHFCIIVYLLCWPVITDLLCHNSLKVQMTVNFFFFSNKAFYKSKEKSNRGEKRPFAAKLTPTLIRLHIHYCLDCWLLN